MKTYKILKDSGKLIKRGSLRASFLLHFFLAIGPRSEHGQLCVAILSRAEPFQPLVTIRAGYDEIGMNSM